MVFFGALSRRSTADSEGFEKPDSKTDSRPLRSGFLGGFRREWQTAVNLLEMAA
jgi:hypothetical protein